MPYYDFDGKQVFFDVIGQGDPLLLLHGNTASSSIFSHEIDFYSKYFQVIVMDFPGHGKSERLERFHTDYWYYNAQAAIMLCRHLKLNDVTVIGTSGGGIVAINMALEAPLLVKRVIADSISGEFLTKDEAQAISNERKKAKKNGGMEFWSSMHGEDWESVIDEDSEMLERFAEKTGRYYHKELSAIKCPVLFTGSLRDNTLTDIERRICDVSRQIKRSLTTFFPSGEHPAMLSTKDDFRKIVMYFLNN